MFPSVAFRPAHLLVVCSALTVVAVALAAWAGRVMFGVFFGAGLGLGLINALLVQRSVAAITAEVNPVKRKMAVNSATRLMVITVVGLTVAWIFRPQGLGVVFGLALFQVVLVISTALPVYKKIRTGEGDSQGDIQGDLAASGESGPNVSYRNPASIADDMFKD